MNDEIHSEDHVQALKKVTAPFEFSLEDIQVVDSIPQWCKDNGVPEDNPYRIAKVVRNRHSGKYLILMPKVVTAEMIEHTRTRMAADGFEVEARRLVREQGWLIHTILFELYHAVHDMLGKQASTAECDRWAFQQMGMLEPE